MDLFLYLRRLFLRLHPLQVFHQSARNWSQWLNCWWRKFIRILKWLYWCRIACIEGSSRCRVSIGIFHSTIWSDLRNDFYKLCYLGYWCHSRSLCSLLCRGSIYLWRIRHVTSFSLGMIYELQISFIVLRFELSLKHILCIFHKYIANNNRNNLETVYFYICKVHNQLFSVSLQSFFLYFSLNHDI